MKVIIAEKPSVAQQIAAVVGATTRREGYISKGAATPSHGPSGTS